MIHQFSTGVRDAKEVINQLLFYIKSHYTKQKNLGVEKQSELFPSVEDIKKEIKLSDEDLKFIFHELQNKGDLENKIFSFYVENNDILKPPEKEKVNLKTILSFFKDSQIYRTVNKNVLIILKIVMSAIATLALIVEVYFNNIYLSGQYDLKIIALILSIIFVSATVLSFECFFIFMKQKSRIKIKDSTKKIIKNPGLMVFFLFLWIICATITIKTTLGGQYNKMIDKMTIDQSLNTNSQNKTLLFTDYSDSIKDKQKDLDSKRLERNKMQQFLQDMTDDKSKSYLNTSYRIYLKDQEINKIITDIDLLKEKKNKMLSENINSVMFQKKDFNAWLAGIFKTDIYIMQFIQNSMYAVFLGIISCLFFAFVLFYREHY